MIPRILIVDDDNLVCISLKKVLIKLGYETDFCLDGGEIFTYIEQFKPDIILLDIYLTSHNGLDLLSELQKKNPEIPVIMITGYADVKIAVSAMKLGAFDFLLKPLDLDQLKIVIEKCVKHLSLAHEVEKLQSIISEEEIPRGFFGKSKVIQNTLSEVEKLAKSDDTTVLIEGESGTGKEVIAKYIHQMSPRKQNVFIPINCGSISKELAESELFGHEKGAFTGAADKIKLGKFEIADNGTILLDEIGELSLELQVKLLRVLQEKSFYRLGGEKLINVNVRVIAATNKNLEDEVKKGNFREDLFYRLNVAKIIIPPLRDRKEDIPLFAQSFVREFSHKFNKSVNRIDEEALNILNAGTWKGNVRELRNAIERAVLLIDEDTLKAKHISFVIKQPAYSLAAEKFELKIPGEGVQIDKVLRELFLKTLKLTGGNQQQAAKILGISRSKFRYRMEKLGIEVTKNIS
ncbi:MAG: sigma-54 dependent transcriptional regulator [Melioribacteraceae bacterium]|nr:sigma-54-dependent Fis family transcriptional regulator [Melioribacteraceae bacterium]MDD3559170.1 sigma-54 dependent transcriptional regulator [Melioribacteraceae bacterium]